MTCRYLVINVILSVLVLACSDVTVPGDVDSGNVSPDEITETITTECTDDSDCSDVVLGPCQVAACQDGDCNAVAVEDGTTCDDANACSIETICLDGVCGSGDNLCDCTTDEDCAAQSDPCLGSYICTDDGAGLFRCTLDEATVVICESSGDDACNSANCEAGECVVDYLDGSPCDDQNACTQVDACDDAGVCIGSDPVVCDTSLDTQCSVTTCVGNTGMCTQSYLTGSDCDDDESCTVDDLCTGTGECVGETVGDFEDCDGGDFCFSGSCLSPTEVQFNPLTCTAEAPGCCPNSQDVFGFIGLYESDGTVFATQSFKNPIGLVSCPADCSADYDVTSVCAVASDGSTSMAGLALLQKANRVRGSNIVGDQIPLFGEISGSEGTVDFDPDIRTAIQDIAEYTVIDLHDLAFETIQSASLTTYRLVGGWQENEVRWFTDTYPYIALCYNILFGSWGCNDVWISGNEGVVKGVNLYTSGDTHLGAWIVAQNRSFHDDSNQLRIYHTPDLGDAGPDDFSTFYTQNDAPSLNGVAEISDNGILAYGENGLLVACVPPDGDGGSGDCTSLSPFGDQDDIRFTDAVGYSGGTVLIGTAPSQTANIGYDLFHVPADLSPDNLNQLNSWTRRTIDVNIVTQGGFVPTKILVGDEGVTIGGSQHGSLFGNIAPEPKVRMYR